VQIRSSAYKIVLSAERHGVSIIGAVPRRITDAPPGLRHQSSLLRDPSRLYRLGFCFWTEKDPKWFLALRVLFASVHPASFPPQGTNSQAAVAPSTQSNFPSLRRTDIVEPLLAEHRVPAPAASHQLARRIASPRVRNHAVSLASPDDSTKINLADESRQKFAGIAARKVCGLIVDRLRIPVRFL
jgi:hypothetical protein